MTVLEMYKCLKVVLCIVLILTGSTVNGENSISKCLLTDITISTLNNPFSTTGLNYTAGQSYGFPLQSEDVIDSSLYLKIEEHLKKIFDKYDLPGMIVAYKIDTNQPEILSFGLADVEYEVPTLIRENHGKTGQLFLQKEDLVISQQAPKNY